jgi:hypothetical protein
MKSMSTRIADDDLVGLHLECIEALVWGWVHSEDHSVDTMAVSSSKQLDFPARREKRNLPFLSAVEPKGRGRIGDGEVGARMRGVGSRTETRVKACIKGRARVPKGRLGGSLNVQNFQSSRKQ